MHALCSGRRQTSGVAGGARGNLETEEHERSGMRSETRSTHFHAWSTTQHHCHFPAHYPSHCCHAQYCHAFHDPHSNEGQLHRFLHSTPPRRGRSSSHRAWGQEPHFLSPRSRPPSEARRSCLGNQRCDCWRRRVGTMSDSLCASCRRSQCDYRPLSPAAHHMTIIANITHI